MFDHGRPWSTVADHGRPWLTMVDHGRPWSVDNGLPWSTIVNHGWPWSARVDLGRPQACCSFHVGAKSTHADARMECRMEHVSRSRADAALLVVSCVLIAFFWKAAAVLFCVCTTRLADFVVIAFWLHRVQHLHAYCAARVPHLFLKSGFKTCTRTSFIFEIVFQQTGKTRTRLHTCL